MLEQKKSCIFQFFCKEGKDAGYVNGTAVPLLLSIMQ
jgi:hypothetical protein